jgi:hypothetical protein
MAKHTHVLTRPHKMNDEYGTRRFMPAGTPCSPSERQVLNMPDVYASADGTPATAAGEAHGLRDKSVNLIKALVLKTEDLALLDEYALEEEAGRNRKGAMGAIQDRIEDLTEGGDEVE